MPHDDRMSPLELRASLALSSIFGLRMLGLFLILPVFAVHARGLPGGESTTLVGLALGVYGLSQGLLQIPFGAASDRFGRKPVIVIGLVIFAIGSVMAALANDVWETIIGRAVQGAGAISAAVTAYIADATRDEQRTKAMAMVGVAIGLTFALSLIGAPPLYAHIGMSGLFMLIGVLCAMAVGVIVWVVPDLPVRAATASRAVPWQDIALDPQLLRLNFGIFVLHAVQMAMFVVVPVLLVDLGLPLPQHGWVYLPVVLLSFALMMPPLLAAERRGRMRLLFMVSIALLMAVQIGIGWITHSVLALAVWLLVFFVGFNVLEASLPSLTTRLAPAASKGLALGVYNTTQSIGLFVGGAVGGWLARHAGAGGVFAFGALVLLLWLFVASGMKELPVTSDQ